MYPADTLEKYAEVLFWGLSVALDRKPKKSSLILVRYDLAALPLAEAVVGLLHAQGMIPIPRANPTARMEYDFYTLANNKRLTYEIPGLRELYSQLTGSISCIAPESLTHLEHVDPENISMANKARRPLRSILQKREQLGEYAWTLCLYPTRELAARAGLDLAAFARVIERACMLTDGAPVTSWKLLRKQADEVKAWLNGLDIGGLRVESDNTDLLLAVGERRKWVGITGRNIPSFEIYTSPDWRGTEGVFYADQPSFRTGNRIKGVTLTFKGGELTRLTADEGEPFALEQAAMDPGARRLGEFALVDKRFSPIDRFMANTLYDENLGGAHGSCHVALGNSYANTFAGKQPQLDHDLKNALGFNMSSLHWDLVSTEPKRVTAIRKDGSRTCIYENGQFTY